MTLRSFNFMRHTSTKTLPQNCIYTMWVIHKENPFSQFGSKSEAVSHCCTQSSILVHFINTPKREEIIFPSHIYRSHMFLAPKSIFCLLNVSVFCEPAERAALWITSASLLRIVLCQSIEHKTKADFSRQLL